MLADFVVLRVFAYIIDALCAALAHARYQDVGVERVGLATKIYVVQLLNTAMMTVLIHVPLGIWQSLPFGLAPSEEDWPIDDEWYKNVGAPLQFTILVNFAVTPIVTILKAMLRIAKNFCWCAYSHVLSDLTLYTSLLGLSESACECSKCVRKGDTLGATTQNELNTKLSYPEWDMSSSYAVVRSANRSQWQLCG